MAVEATASGAADAPRRHSLDLKSNVMLRTPQRRVQQHRMSCALLALEELPCW
jgi:hypothetical protein